MQTCRFKARDRSNDWKCCFCCHVRTGTIFFGIWHLVLALSVLAVVLRHPELMSYDHSSAGPEPTPLAELEMIHDEGGNLQLTLGQIPERPISIQNNNFASRASYYRDVNTCVIFTFCTFMITLLMVYGAIKGKPVYLLPFFCLQVFDFCLSSLTAVGFVLYMPDVHGLVAHSPRIPYQTELLQLNEQCLSLLVLLTFLVALLVKAYFIGVVWSCYKYLMLRVFPGQRTIHYIDTESLLPSYEAAVKKYVVPPPSYDTAVRTTPTTTVTAEQTNTTTAVTAAAPPPQPM
ncbi:lysosomal-associated transmembrane protein 4A isoform X2 [Macrosteles quadrilineatus]|uniref:lysosomal-associated transmembrane protein 4A isoform X2 n=1 Tax=Macrosteles quadrilineatus TaxID=74068 RepID=UPI0023E2BB37|nr:lysosomal-associated transmembrane protein 4A isoform X2 [Macrosteles quadrilineatus]